MVGLVVVGSGAGGLLLSRSSSEVLREVGSAELPLQRANSQMRDAVVRSSSELRAFIVTGDASSLESMRANRRDYEGALAVARQACPTSPGGLRPADRPGRRGAQVVRRDRGPGRSR